MSKFSSTNHSVADVAAARSQIWELLSDAETLCSLTPLVTEIRTSGTTWVWKLRGLSALGVSIAPTFTESMTFDEPGTIRFTHKPPDGKSERAGAEGVYLLEELSADSTRLSIDITLCVELPLPRLARRAVESTMASMMQRTGARFATNLYQRLGIDEASLARPA